MAGSGPTRAVDLRRLAVIAWARSSEHAVLVRRLRRDVLDDVPMLDDLAVLDAENVDDRAAGRAVPARRVHVQHDEITFGEDALDLAALIRKAHLEKIDERSQTLGAVGGRQIGRASCRERV